MGISVSVCIANFNGIDIIDACVESVRRQVFDWPVEIIVHDDASSDGSAEHIRSRHPDLRLIESKRNVGFCVANNRMADIAQGEFLLLLNNDATLMKDGLQSLHNEAVGLAQPAILTLPQFDHVTGALIDRGCLLDPFFNPVPNLDAERRDVAMVMGACLWVPRQLWQRLGGFPAWFESIGEDLFLCCRARLAGHPVRVLRTSGYAHRIGASFGGGKIIGKRLSTTTRRRALSERNKTFAMMVFQPTTLLLASLPLHLLFLYIEGLAVSLNQRSLTVWRAVYAPLMKELWTERQRLRTTRQDNQSIRKVNLTEWLSVFQWAPRKLEMLLKHGFPKVK